MAFKEESWLPLSGLQHFAFCRRQWALIHKDLCLPKLMGRKKVADYLGKAMTEGSE